ncbi:hypothetical protein [Pendulispora albinea]|uniref:Glycosyltransferase RgtA/B/C/D-like domain-containing protein n=1 Tax=Pendulispora albinea TaxID=2741071 RepID=A0ABZ2M5F2_9BACT
MAVWRARAASSWPSIAPAVLVTACLAYWAIGGVLAKLGHPGATLDDSFIHFQYARSFAEGHPLRFQPGEPISTGATSLLWPLLLAPFYLLGFRDLAILWPAWLLSFAALAMLAREVYRLTRPLAGQAAAISAAAMVPAFGGLVWCAASGMEAVPFAWAIARTIRLCADWPEVARDRDPSTDARRRRHLGELVAFAWAAFLLRPEGAFYTLIATATLLVFPSGPGLGARARALLPLAVPGFVALGLRLVSGSVLTSTAHVKLLVGNPYYGGGALWGAVEYNVKLLYDTLLNGKIWSAEFIPAGGAVVGLLGLASIAFLGWREQQRWRALLIVLLAVGIAIPCFYVSFLWNRLRYLWPFASGWFVGLACLARLAGDGLARIRPRWRIVTPILGGTFVGLFASKLSGTLDDIANCASGIDRQQVKLGRWAKANLPRDVRIGLNDTGAIAYFSERPTFDVVGLTTPGEGRHWVAGPGSRFEHYERLAALDPKRLPTHFIVYPEWMACDPVLGAMLTEAVVLDSTVLGGTTMRAYLADWRLLGSGERPWTSGLDDAQRMDALDVADVASEAEHAYDLAGARDGQNLVRSDAVAESERPATVVDGGRTGRRVERFVLHLRDGAKVRVVARLESAAANVLRVRVSGRELPPVTLAASASWTETVLEIPPDAVKAETPVEISAAQPFAAYHYWAFASP